MTDYGAIVCPGIYIGSYQTAMSTAVGPADIGAIVNLSGRQIDSPLPVYSVLIDDVLIVPATKLSYLCRFRRAAGAIKTARMAGVNVLVVCAAGINRSATTIGVYLLECGWSLDDVITALIRANTARGVPLLTNPSFRALLQEYFDTLYGGAGPVSCMWKEI